MYINLRLNLYENFLKLNAPIVILQAGGEKPGQGEHGNEAEFESEATQHPPTCEYVMSRACVLTLYSGKQNKYQEPYSMTVALRISGSVKISNSSRLRVENSET